MRCGHVGARPVSGPRQAVNVAAVANEILTDGLWRPLLLLPNVTHSHACCHRGCNWSGRWHLHSTTHQRSACFPGATLDSSRPWCWLWNSAPVRGRSSHACMRSAAHNRQPHGAEHNACARSHACMTCTTLPMQGAMHRRAGTRATAAWQPALHACPVMSRMMPLLLLLLALSISGMKTTSAASFYQPALDSYCTEPGHPVCSICSATDSQGQRVYNNPCAVSHRAGPIDTPKP